MTETAFPQKGRRNEKTFPGLICQKERERTAALVVPLNFLSGNRRESKKQNNQHLKNVIGTQEWCRSEFHEPLLWDDGRTGRGGRQ